MVCQAHELYGKLDSIAARVESFLARNVYDRCSRFGDDGMWVGSFAIVSDELLQSLRVVYDRAMSHEIKQTEHEAGLNIAVRPANTIKQL